MRRGLSFTSAVLLEKLHSVAWDSKHNIYSYYTEEIYDSRGTQAPFLMHLLRYFASAAS